MKPTDRDKKYLKHNKKLGFQLQVEKFKEEVYHFVGTFMYYLIINPVNSIFDFIKKKKKQYWLKRMDQLKLKMFDEIKSEIEHDIYKHYNDPSPYTVTAKITTIENSPCDWHIGEFIQFPHSYTSKKERKTIYKYTMLYHDLKPYQTESDISFLANECLNHIYRYFQYVNDDTIVEWKEDEVVDRSYNRVSEEYISVRLK